MMDNLVDKAYRSYEYISRYASFPYSYDTNDSKYIYGTTSYLKDDISYVIHKVNQNDTFDSIALKYYNNPTLYWVICDFNKIQDPFINIEVGTEIKVPTLSNISFAI